jgi:KaiC/GvpD/RAD55 family RecA-like ATPase
VRTDRHQEGRDRVKKLARGDVQLLRAALEEAGVSGWSGPGQRSCRCPFHEDKNPSAEIKLRDGEWRFKCYVCTELPLDVFDVRAKHTGKPVAEVLREAFQEAGVGAPAAKTAAPASRDALEATGGGPTGEPPTPAPNGATAPGRVYATLEELRLALLGSLPGWQLEDEYPYTNPDTGIPDLVVFRLTHPGKPGKKEIRQARPALKDGTGGWLRAGPDAPYPLFNRRLMRTTPRVVVVEGEKKAKRLAAVFWKAGLRDVTATTAPMGAGKARLTDWSPLAGKDTVWVWPDADPPDPRTGKRPGPEQAAAAAELVQKLDPPPRQVRLVNADALGLPPHGDAWDFLEREAALIAAAGGAATDQLLLDALDTKVLTPAPALPNVSEPLRQYYLDVGTGQLAALQWPWPALSAQTFSLQPGAITVVVGEAGAGKSFFLTETLWHWLTRGWPAAGLMLEKDVRFHAQRLHAQLAAAPQLLDPGWLGRNGPAAEALYRAHAPEIDQFWRAVDEVPAGKTYSAADVGKWVEGRLRAGARGLFLDPITALGGDRPWEVDSELLRQLQRLLKDHHATLVIVSHPDAGGKRQARSEGMSRFTDTVLWLKPEEPRKRGAVYGPGGAKMAASWNLSLRLGKVRLGRGRGKTIAFDFDPRVLRFAEVGVIAKDDAPGPQVPGSTGGYFAGAAPAGDGIPSEGYGEGQDDGDGT